MLINLDYWRQNKLYERTIEFMRDNKVHHADQDALNNILIGRWISLPAVWNDHAQCAVPVPPIRNKDIADPAIVHFLGEYKPWDWLCKHPFKYEYRKYRLKTPWRRYREDGQPQPPSLLRDFSRAVLPNTLRRWLRSQLVSLKS